MTIQHLTYSTFTFAYMDRKEAKPLMPAGPAGMAIFASRPKLRLRPARRANISTPDVLQAICASDASCVSRTWWFVFVLFGTGCVKAGAASNRRPVVVILVHVAVIRQDPLLDAFVLGPMRCKLVSVVWHRILHVLRRRHAFSLCARRCINAMATSTGPLVRPLEMVVGACIIPTAPGCPFPWG